MTIPKCPPVILLEFNELTPVLMERFMTEGLLPNFKKLHDQSTVFTTTVQDDPDYLEPWIQWVTVHTGLETKQHGVFHLSDAAKLQAEPIWTTIARHGLRVCVCGSMNTNYTAPIDGYILPDPWSIGFDPYPDELRPFYRFVQVNVQEHTNKTVPLNGQDYFRFLTFMLTHGLSIGTVWAAVRQFISERFRPVRWKRAVMLDKLQWDLFAWIYKRRRPQFSTFFLNSTAHFQHLYWRNMEPDRFQIQPRPEEQSLYQSAILYGYQEMDKVIEKALALDPTATIIFCTGFGQQPYLLSESRGGKWFHRPKQFDLFVREFELRGVVSVVPVMAHQFHIYFETEDLAKEAEVKLRAVSLEGRRFFSVERTGSDIFSGCHIHERLPESAVLRLPDGRTVFAREVFYTADGSLKSGMHHPDGMLWFRKHSGNHSIITRKQSLYSIAPTILNLFGIPKLPQMIGDPLDLGDSEVAVASSSAAERGKAHAV